MSFFLLKLSLQAEITIKISSRCNRKKLFLVENHFKYISLTGNIYVPCIVRQVAELRRESYNCIFFRISSGPWRFEITHVWQQSEHMCTQCFHYYILHIMSISVVLADSRVTDAYINTAGSYLQWGALVTGH